MKTPQGKVGVVQVDSLPGRLGSESTNFIWLSEPHHSTHEHSTGKSGGASGCVVQRREVWKCKWLGWSMEGGLSAGPSGWVVQWREVWGSKWLGCSKEGGLRVQLSNSLHYEWGSSHSPTVFQAHAHTVYCLQWQFISNICAPHFLHLPIYCWRVKAHAHVQGAVTQANDQKQRAVTKWSMHLNLTTAQPISTSN